MNDTANLPNRAHGTNSNLPSWPLLFAAWMIALVSTLGALFIGEVMGQTPCVLCWYQRVFMFPLSVMLAIACYRSDTSIWRYALPLAAAGWLIAAYHVLVYFGVIPEAMAPCSSTGPSCASTEMTIFGGMPIPLLSLSAFTLIAVLLAFTAQRHAP